jgi:hypothetical protein
MQGARVLHLLQPHNLRGRLHHLRPAEGEQDRVESFFFLSHISVNTCPKCKRLSDRCVFSIIKFNIF